MSDSEEQVMKASEREIEYQVKGKVAVITINRPKRYNAMNIYHYWALDEAVNRAAAEPGTVATIIQSTGKYFSSGADVEQGAGVPSITTQNFETDWKVRRYYAGRFTGRNAIAAHSFWNHPKILVVALNGPVVGLTASLISLADFIFAKESSFMLTPFANLSLVAEGASSFTLPVRLGLSLANKALLASEPVTAEEMHRVGFINKLYPADMPVDEFNAKVWEYTNERFSGLDAQSMKEIKDLIHAPYQSHFSQASAAEIIGGLDKFSRGLPQVRFSMIAKKTMRHKL